ncbi:hypothetical protein [Lihuaxuella thermophila]|uniref:Uncharacterized protein n=1 Tax=Lihuaxuella thermophila TaxID=1173111 RepID=A0A1H8GA11_9BACL|nr:hypothetical protein [Lihuaxuella thermophila]SEN40118.1 hypothetical protein SAMN05444955_110134 [Lihuaxuella thermophila]
MESQASIEQHLKQAFFHLTAAVNESLNQVEKNESEKVRLGAMWEAFLSQFFSYVKEKGKEKRINMIGWIPLTKIAKWL